MKNIYAVLTALAFAVLLAGCDETVPSGRKVTDNVIGSTNNPGEQALMISGIERILMHKPGEFTFIQRSKGTNTLILHTLTCEPKQITLITDVGPEKLSWVEYTTINPAWDSCLKMVIHLHSSDEINPAGWSRRVGKRTEQGTTVEIE